MAEEPSERKAPYVPAGTFTNFVAELAKRPDMLPRRIDKSLMKGMSGGTQSQLIIALRFLGLVTGENDSTTSALDDLVREDEDGRKAWAATALGRYYPEAMELSGRNGTAGELAELFTNIYGHKGSTRDKAIRFFLQMAQYADLELSPHFAVPRLPPTTSKKRNRRGPADNLSGTASDPPPVPRGDTYQVTLQAGGTVIVTVAESHFNLSLNRSDRDFVNLLVDAMTDYAARGDQQVEVSTAADQEASP